jgi:hypothetical protein
MKIVKLPFLLNLLPLIIALLACNKSSTKTTPTCDGTASTYNSNIKAIIDGACTSSGCHPGYTSYSAIKTILDNGQFKKEVLTNQTMPKNTKLSTDQLNKIQCWADAGFIEK